jgi:hypothetical protein
MPSTSKKQHNFMAAIAHNPAFAKKVGIPQSVGKDFNDADKGKKFRSGGMMKHEDIKLDKKVVKKAIGMHDKQLHGGKATNLTKLKKGGTTMKKCYDKGGSINDDIRARAMKSVEGLEGIKGADIADETGTVKGSIKRNEYGDLYDSEMKAAPKAKPRIKAKKSNVMTDAMSRMNAMGDTYKKGGSVSSASSRADGCAIRGKTKGRII